MKVGVLGSGVVATVLASGFLKHGHQVKVGTGTAGKLAKWQEENAGGSVGSFAEAAEFGDLLVLAVKRNSRRRGASAGRKRESGGKNGCGCDQPDCRFTA